MTHRYPNVTVKLIMRCRGNIFMLRHHADGAYDFPGGQMEWGESPEETPRRELREELNYELQKTPVLFGVWSYIADGNSRHSVQLQYFLSLQERPQFEVIEPAEPLWLDKDFLLGQFGDKALVGRLFSRHPVR